MRKLIVIALFFISIQTFAQSIGTITKLDWWNSYGQEQITPRNSRGLFVTGTSTFSTIISQLSSSTAALFGNATTTNATTTGSHYTGTLLSNIASSTSAFFGNITIGNLGRLKFDGFSPTGVPAIYADNDDNSGIHFDGPDTVSIHTGGSDRILANSMGYVGISTNTPAYPLDVYGNSRIDGTLLTTGNIGSASNRIPTIYANIFDGNYLNINQGITNYGIDINVNEQPTTTDQYIRFNGYVTDPVIAFKYSPLLFDFNYPLRGTTIYATSSLFDNSTTSNLAITGLTNSVLSTNSNGLVVGTSTPTFSDVYISNNATTTNLFVTSLKATNITQENNGGQSNSLQLKRTTGGAGLIASGMEIVVDSNTLAGIYGIQNEATDAISGGTLSFYTRQNSGGSMTEKMRLTHDGKLGIGTTTPTRLLHLEQSSGSEVVPLLIKNASGDATLAFTTYYGSSLTGQITNDNVGSGLYALRFSTYNYDDTLNIVSGNVGIGTTTPGTALGVTGSGVFTGLVMAPNFVATNTTATSTFASTTITGTLAVNSTATTTFYNKGINLTAGCYAVNGTCLSGSMWNTSGSDIYYNTGKVGIGTTSPFAILSVGGNTYLGGNVTATGTLAVTGAITGASTITGNGKVTGNVIQTSANTANYLTSSPFFDTDFFPSSTSTNLIYRFARNTNTSGTLSSNWYMGNGLNQPMMTFDHKAGRLSITATSTNTTDALTVTGSSTITGYLLVNSYSLYVDALNNRVGIGGTTTPGTALGVTGSGVFTGNLTFPSFTATNTASTNYIAGTLGIGTTTSQSGLSVLNANYPVIHSIRSDTDISTELTSLLLEHRTTNDMIDDFGTKLDFGIKDSSNVLNTIASISAVREGADNTGSLLFYTNSGGVTDVRLKIATSGDVIINNGDLDLFTNGKGIIFHSSGGNCFKKTIDNDGNDVNTSITCPTY